MCFSCHNFYFFLSQFSSFLGHWGLVGFCLSFFLQVEGRFFCSVEFLFDHVGEGFYYYLQLWPSDLYSSPLSPIHPPFICLLCCHCFLLIPAKLKRDGVIMAIVFFCWVCFDILMVVF